MNLESINVIAKKVAIESVNVTTRWLVEVKLYGIIPIRLLQSKNAKVVNTRGKYFFPFSPICSCTRFTTNS